MLAVTQEINSNILGGKSQTREVGEKIVQKVLCKITFHSFAKGTTEQKEGQKLRLSKNTFVSQS